MKIHDVVIVNWIPPGESFWDYVKERHEEPLIEATIKIKLSWDEYRELLDKAKIDSFSTANPTCV